MRRLIMLIALLLTARAAFAGPDPNTLPYPSQTSLSLNHSNVFFSPQVSSPPIQFQNQGTPLGVSFIFNCSTGMSCSFVNGVMTATATGGGGTIVIPATVSGATSGGIPCFDSTTDMNTSAAIVVNDAITGGGAGACAKDSGVPVLLPDADTTSVAIGGALGSQSSTSINNVGIGVSAGANLTTGSHNVVMGYQALQGTASDHTDGNNVAIGYTALQFPVSSSNVAIGDRAGNTLRSGGNDVFIGAQSQPAVNSDANEIVVGYLTTGAGANTATIGNASVTDHFVGGATGLAYENSAGFIDRGSTPTITGTGACATVSTQAGGATAGTVKCTGTTGASTLTITFAKTAPNGWTCDVWDETTRADNPSQTSHSQTTCVVTATAIAANDVLVFKAFAW